MLNSIIRFVLIIVVCTLLVIGFAVVAKVGLTWLAWSAPLVTTC